MEQQAEEVLESALKSYGDVFVAVGQAGAQACPPVGKELKESLLNLRERLNAEASASAIVETEQLLEAELLDLERARRPFLSGQNRRSTGDPGNRGHRHQKVRRARPTLL